MKQTLIKLFSITLLGGAIAYGSSCKKESKVEINQNEEASVVVGCMNLDGFNYNPLATTEGVCTFIKTTMYEISYHAEFNGSGNDWDALINKKADLILRIKEQGATDWMFEGDVKNNQTYSDPAQWTAPTAEVLKNKNYEWELVDDETIGSAELMASGSFNPNGLTNTDNEIVTNFTDANGLVTQLKIYYFIQ